jgi:TPR repeat protein
VLFGLATLAAFVYAQAAGAGDAPPLTREAVAATVKGHLPEVSACYQKAALKKPWLAGRLVVSFTIERDGAVSRAEIERTELPDVRLLACVQDAVRTWRFARPAEAPADFSYPFVLGGGRGGDPSVLVDGRPRPVTLPARCKLPVECRELGLGLVAGGEADQKKAFEYFTTGCGLRDAASCAGQAAALDFGRGAEKDRKRAFAAYQKSCALGNQRACTTVAMFHALGVEGVTKKDAGKGLALLARACDAGEGAACLNLAQRDQKRAAELRKRALELAGD